MGLTKKEFSTRKFTTFLDQYYTNQHEKNVQIKNIAAAKERKSVASAFGDRTFIKNGDLYIKKGNSAKFGEYKRASPSRFNTIQASNGASMKPRGFRKDWKNSYRKPTTNDLSFARAGSPKPTPTNRKIYGDHRAQAALDSEAPTSQAQEFNSSCYM